MDTRDLASKFYYDETSPSGLRWKIDVYSGRGRGVLNVKAGQRAGNLSKGRWQVGKKQWLVHRVIWILTNGEIPEDIEIDHIDGNAQNNVISNLRAVTKEINARNRKLPTNNSSGICGVSLRRSRGNAFWVSQWVTVEGENKSKWFSILKYGDYAFTLACSSREESLLNMNNNGAGYTSRHGTKEK